MTNHDDLCEKVGPEYSEEQYRYHSDTLTQLLKNGVKTKSPVDTLIDIQHFVGQAIRWHVHDVLKRDKCLSGKKDCDCFVCQISSLKLKLEVAEKEIEQYQKDIAEQNRQLAHQEAKLSGSCEGMTVEEIKSAAIKATRALRGCSGATYTLYLSENELDVIAKAIHAQMTGGKK